MPPTGGLRIAEMLSSSSKSKASVQSKGALENAILGENDLTSYAHLRQSCQGLEPIHGVSGLPAIEV